ncbi:hypothetical protein SASPL_133468 [Salvia splendens]|uniref:Uncharacterized protein n=1 Tax=Salvia splendens TaxID=180675 RepID=A0A8X8X488_SALSN|nr:hypothetical protein SASPL_133468 [Salvia splendens]
MSCRRCSSPLESLSEEERSHHLSFYAYVPPLARSAETVAASGPGCPWCATARAMLSRRPHRLHRWNSSHRCVARANGVSFRRCSESPAGFPS